MLTSLFLCVYIVGTMKEIKTTIYECEFCRKYYKHKHHAKMHELKCKKNPANYRPCFGCVHLNKKIVSIDDDYAGYRVSLLFCDKKNEHVYPPQCDIRKNVIDYGENYPMPKECDDADWGMGDEDLLNIF